MIYNCKVKREIIRSEDGSPTLFVEELNEHYHSVYGARTESEHIFISAGLKYMKKDPLNILEIGFGTGLNAYLTLQNQEKRKISYTGIEKYPLLTEEYELLDYSVPEDKNPGIYLKMHQLPWESRHEIITGFTLLKSKQDLNDFIPPAEQDIIYFDAFAPSVQPDLWSVPNFKKLFECLNTGGILVTYSVKGMVRRNLKECGFSIEKIPGPKGKRHVLRALR